MLLLVFLLPPLALYLLVLGWINRRPRPVLMGGAWEFAGVLFGLSGFLLVGGPAFLASLDEQSRWFWLLGEAAPAESWTPPIWIVVRLLYFAVVAGGAAFVLWRCRRLTSIYNINTRVLFTALDQAFQQLGLPALRSGHSFLIGGRPPKAAGKEVRSEAVQTAKPRIEPDAAAPAPTIGEPSTALHVDVFPAMRHVTLRWDPADSPVRREVEQELTRTVAEAAPPEQETLHGGCLSLVGVLLFALALVAGGLLILYRLYPPR